MKYFVCCSFACLIIINCLIWVKIDRRQKDLETETNIKLLQMSDIIESQEKQIRILKQDVDIIENGFREKGVQ